jgi:hypothetical protein
MQVRQAAAAQPYCCTAVIMSLFSPCATTNNCECLQAKRKYLNPEEVPDWMRYSKKELEEKQKQEAEAGRKARKKHKHSSSSSSDSDTSSSSTSSGSTSSSSSGERWLW